jgi:hypothetical protein
MYTTGEEYPAQRTNPAMPRMQWMANAPRYTVHAGAGAGGSMGVSIGRDATPAEEQRRLGEGIIISPSGRHHPGTGTGTGTSPIKSPTLDAPIVLDDISWRSNCGPVLIALPADIAAQAATAAAVAKAEEEAKVVDSHAVRPLNTSPVLPPPPQEQRRPSTSTMEDDQRTSTSTSTPGMSDSTDSQLGAIKDREHEHEHEHGHGPGRVDEHNLRVNCTAHTPPRVPSLDSDEDDSVHGGFSMTNSALHSMRSRSYSNSDAVRVMAALGDGRGNPRMGASWNVTHEAHEAAHEVDHHAHERQRGNRAHSYSDGCSEANGGFVSDRGRLVSDCMGEHEPPYPRDTATPHPTRIAPHFVPQVLALAATIF